MALKASAAPKVQELLRGLLPHQPAGGRRAAVGSARRGTPAKHGHLEECACDPARTAAVCARVDGKGREVVSAGCEGGKELGLSEEASRCPCPRLLIYEPKTEISHLSLFIFFLHIFFSPSMKLNFPSESCPAANRRRNMK